MSKNSGTTKINVKIHSTEQQGNVLARATVDLNGCFAIRGVRVMEGSKGPFVSMPSYKAGSEFKDVCFPCTKEFKQEFDEAVLSAYRQEMGMDQQGQEQVGPEMTM